MVNWFEPYIIKLDHVREGRQFLIGTPQAEDWYDPLPKPWILELKWLMERVKPGMTFLDGGVHHGLHSTIVGGEGINIFGIDVHRPHLNLAYVNAEINHVPLTIVHGALANIDGVAFYNGEALGSLREDGIKVPCTRVQSLCPEVDVVKLDLEGAEFWVVPDCIDALPNAKTWMVEIHPYPEDEEGHGNPWSLANMFVERGYNVQWIDRSRGDDAQIEPYYDGVPWQIWSTILCERGE